MAAWHLLFPMPLSPVLRWGKMAERLASVPCWAVKMESNQTKEGADEVVGLITSLEMARDAKIKQLLLAVRHTKVHKPSHCLIRRQKK